MLVSDINPVIRYATGSGLLHSQGNTCSADSRLVYVSGGSARFFYEGTEHSVSEGCLLIWPAGHCYSFEDPTDLSLFIFNFDFTQQNASITESIPIVSEKDFDASTVTEQVEFDDCEELNGLILRRDMQQIRPKLEEIVREFRESKRFFRETAGAILKQALTEVVRSLPTRGRTEDAADRVIAFIRDNYARPITNREIAACVSYHEFYVNKLILRRTGMTLHRYLTTVRVQNAARMLITTETPANRIAELCGFTSPAYFVSAFRRIMNETPGGYRKRHGGIL